jgi:hypothetical protein
MPYIVPAKEKPKQDKKFMNIKKHSFGKDVYITQFTFVFLCLTLFVFLVPISIVFADQQVILLDNKPSTIKLGQYFEDENLDYDFFLYNSSSLNSSHKCITS